MHATEETIRIKSISPPIGIPGGDVTVSCDGLHPFNLDEDSLHFCGSPAMIEAASEHKLLAQIPNDLVGDEVCIFQNGHPRSNRFRFTSPPVIANALHNVGNPAVSADGRVYATFSGMSGQLMPVSVFLIEPDREKVPIISGIMNPTDLLFGRDGMLYISSRYDGKVYRSDSVGNYEAFSQGLGLASGMAMDSRGVLFVGDQNGTVFRVDRDGHADFFARLPPSQIAYHLAIDSLDNLYVTVPLSIGENILYRISAQGVIDEYYRDLAEFHAVAVDASDRLVLATTNRGRGSLSLIEEGRLRPLLAGEGIVGMAFSPAGDLYFVTFDKLYRLDGACLRG